MQQYVHIYLTVAVFTGTRMALDFSDNEKEPRMASAIAFNLCLVLAICVDLADVSLGDLI